jgi:hypothetical protein
MFVFTVLALVAVASAQFPFPGLGGSLPTGGNNNNGNNGGVIGNGGFQLDSNILTTLGNLFKGQNGGSGNGATVDANGTFSFTNIGEFLNNAGLKLSPDLSAENIKASLSNLNLGSLGLKGDSLQDVRNIISRFTDSSCSTARSLPPTAPISMATSSLRVPSRSIVCSRCSRARCSRPSTRSFSRPTPRSPPMPTPRSPPPSLSSSAAMPTSPRATSPPASSSSTPRPRSSARSRCSATTSPSSPPRPISSSATTSPTRAPRTRSPRSSPSSTSPRTPASRSTDPPSLIGNIGGNGNITIKSLLDLTGASRLGGAIDSEALIKAKTLILDKLADLKLQVQANSGILSNITQGLDFGGAKIDITIPENIKQTVLKFIHGSATGKAQISIDGKSVIDVTSGAPAGTPPAGTADANGNVWTVNYGEKETTLELKNEKEVYAATTAVDVLDSSAHSGVASTTIAVAAVVAAIAVTMN